MSRVLEPVELNRQLLELRDWTHSDASIVRSIDFPTFPTAIKFVDLVAIDAEAMNHHPDIDIRWRTVTIRLSTHSEGGLTQLDIELAHQIDAIANPLIED